MTDFSFIRRTSLWHVIVRLLINYHFSVMHVIGYDNQQNIITVIRSIIISSPDLKIPSRISVRQSESQCNHV